MKRLPQLDGIRGIAIVLVLVWHYCQFVPMPYTALYYLHRSMSLAWSGVDLFFVLSGFLIAGILLDHRESSNYFRVFYFRRVCRIFPVYFLVLGLFVCASATSLASAPQLQWLFKDPFPLWSYATFTQNILAGTRGSFGPGWLAMTWSLAVEEQFYLIVPLLIYFLPRRILACIIVAAILMAPALRWWSPGFHAYVSTPWRSDSLLSGSLLALLVRWRPFLPTVFRHQQAVLSLFVALLAGAAAMTVRTELFGPLNHLLLAGLYSALVLIAFADIDPAIGRLLRRRPLVWFGQLSYGIYMYHQAVQGLMYGALSNHDPMICSLADAAVVVLSLGVTLALALASYHLLELPIIRLGHRSKFAGPQPVDTNPPQTSSETHLRHSAE